MEPLPTKHELLKLEGTARQCGRDYGESQAESIDAFLHWQATPNKKRRDYARRCWARLRHWDEPVVEFVRGMAEGSGHTLTQTTLLLLHEEIAHMKKCTAFGATGSGTRDGQPIIAQNWDWSPILYPWSSLLRMRTDTMPASLTYAYPGLWAATGINEHGLSLAWTSSGAYPRIPPKVGIPTYALIAGILARRDCRGAIELLERSAIAGCFIFFLADAAGEVWVVEGFPGQVVAAQCDSVVSRANHYECEPSRQATGQKLPRPTVRKNSVARARRMAQLVKEHSGKINPRVAEAILRDHGLKPGLSICQHPVPRARVLTLDSMYMLPAKKQLRIARGSPCRRAYRRYSVQ